MSQQTLWSTAGAHKEHTQMDVFDVAGERFDFPKEEERVLAYWDAIDAFHRSDALAADRPAYTFLDGPPFATGLPHYGHILAGTVKDTVTRYAAATGHRVARVFGWDCHGLPVEHEIDKKHNISCRADVEAMGGVAAYNAECRAIVMRYAGDWKATVRRMARWIDMDRDYKTMYPSFMESVWWAFAELHAKGLVYRGVRVMPYSTACATPLSNFEIALCYRDVTELSVTVAMPLIGALPEALVGASLLLWTTTPWTLPANLAVAVGPDMDYVVAQCTSPNGGRFVVAQALAAAVLGEHTVVATLKGTGLVGLRYAPLFEHYAERVAAYDKTFSVLAGSFVTADVGTGVVHMAPAFGEDDLNLCVSTGVVSETDVPCPVDDAGRLTVAPYSGVFWRDASAAVARDIEAAGRLFGRAQTTHSVPHCWRSDTQLIYRAVPCWFVRVASATESLVSATDDTHWVPSFVRDKRFRNWLEGARDWAVSRNRYWGTPIPMWASEDFSEVVAVGSVAQLEDLAGLARGSVTDLHRETVDAIVIPSKKTPGTVLRRVTEVFDCWFESGCVPFAQHHYPFENRDAVEATYPADFIGEGLDQTRGWFYTLTVLGVHLFGRSPFRNVIVNGLVLAADGKKMSKRLKNYPEPSAVFDAHGADALRLYLIDSPVVRAEPLRFKEDGVRAVVRDVLLPLWNALRFFAQSVDAMALRIGQASVPDLLGEGLDAQTAEALSKPGAVALGSEAIRMSPAGLKAAANTTDGWILAAMQTLVRTVRAEMAAYRLYGVLAPLTSFVGALTNWYIRLNRRRLRGDAGLVEQRAAVAVLEHVLQTYARVLAPFAPLFAEGLYLRLNPAAPASWAQGMPDAADVRSVHFLPFPEVDGVLVDDDIVADFAAMQAVVERGRTLREAAGVPLKTPLAELVVLAPDSAAADRLLRLHAYVCDELNVRAFHVLAATADTEAAWGVAYRASPNFRALGQRLKADLGAVQKALRALPPAELRAFTEAVAKDPMHTLVLAGHALSAADVCVSRVVDEKTPLVKDSRRYAVGQAALAASASSAVSADGPETEDAQPAQPAAVVFLSTDVDAALRDEGMARELVAHVQRMRKNAGCRTTDTDVHVRLAPRVPEAERLLDGQIEYLTRMLRSCTVGQAAETGDVFAADTVDLGDGVSVAVALARLQ